MLCQYLLDAVHHLQRHPMAFPQFWRAVRAVQHEHGLTICRDDVDIGGAVIGHIDSHAQAIESKGSWHWYGYNLNAWVFQWVAGMEVVGHGYSAVISVGTAETSTSRAACHAS